MDLWTFQQDVTPPVGDYLCGGLRGRAASVETPLWLRGLILRANGTFYVIAAIDFCYLVGRSQHRLEQALADGAGIPVEQVALHSTHVHAAPLINEETHAILAEFGSPVHNENYFRQVLDGGRRAVSAALKRQGTAIGGVSFARHPVDQFASTRRVLDANGRCQVRFSICRDEAIRNAPEGKIDPLLRQIVFFDTRSRPVAAMSFYASHPQVSDGRVPVVISGDTIGVAVDLFEKAYPGVFPIYFTGAGGDITAGKYTTMQYDRNRLVFGVRLFDGMDGAYRQARAEPISKVAWATQRFDVPLAKITEPASHYEQILQQEAPPSSTLTPKYLAGLKLHRLRDGIHICSSRLSRLRLNGIEILFMPSEMIVDYQIYANSRLGPKSAVAAYGDCFLNYVATDECFDQGGYEVDPRWTEVGRGTEGVVKGAIDRIAMGS